MMSALMSGIMYINPPYTRATCMTEDTADMTQQETEQACTH